ncbi:MAG: RpiR family transcriptional regulator [Bacteroidaceae bacterium]|nr:RpiR family transcriptional regulator [Bacteroidaceae bacterium]
MTAKDLTQEQREWFVANFDHTKNQELADHLGISVRTVTRMARELGLWKTKEFVAAMQRNASEHGARANRLMGGNAGAVNLLKYGKATRFKPGTSQKERMSAEAFADMHRRIGLSRKETFKKERRRVIFGLEQKTNLRVVQCPREKVLLRLNLRRHGYEIPRASNEATVTNETRRSIRMEARAEKMGIKFNFNNLAL